MDEHDVRIALKSNYFDEVACPIGASKEIAPGIVADPHPSHCVVVRVRHVFACDSVASCRRVNLGHNKRTTKTRQQEGRWSVPSVVLRAIVLGRVLVVPAAAADHLPSAKWATRDVTPEVMDSTNSNATVAAATAA